MLRKRLLLWILAVSVSALQSFGADMRMIHLSNINQLPSNTINAICQDQKGFIWIGTENGLCRWDGSNMEVFEPSLEDPFALPSKSILKLFADSQDRIWVITSQGLRFYDYETNHFSSVKQDIASVSPCAICESSQKLYLGIGDILHYFNEDEQRFEPVFVHGSEVRNRFTSMAVDNEDEIWASTKTDGLIHLNRANTFITHYKTNRHSPEWLNSNQINTLYLSHSGLLWIGTDDRGVSCFNVEKNCFNTVRELSDLSISSFCEDADNKLWVGTDRGLYILDQESGAILDHYTKNPSNNSFLSDNLITVILRDREQNMIVGTRNGGIDIQPYITRQFSFYDWGTEQHNLSGRTVRQIVPDRDGNILVATEDANLNKLVRRTGRTQVVHLPGIDNANPCALLWDSKMRLWIGTTSNGLYRYSPQTADLEQYKVSAHSALSTNHILSLLEDTEGRIWVGTASGLVVYDESKDLFIQFDPYTFRKQSINHLMLDDAGNIWIATSNQGLFYFDAVEKTVRRFNLGEVQTGSANPIRHINYVYQDSKRRYWFSTNYNGLICHDIARDSFTAYSVLDHLLSNTVYSVIEDGNGNIWASTDNGLSCYNEASRSFENYTVSDGLPNKQFSNNSAYCSPDGYLFFGTINGMISFHPDSLKMASNWAKVELTGFKVMGENGLKYPAGDYNLSDGGFIHLSFAQAKSFSVSYTVPSISHASSLFFATSFGPGAGWNYVGTQNQINFANLAPGEYLLRLKASFNNRWDGDEPVSGIRIVVDAPFWRSKIMLAFYGILLLSLLFIFWKAGQSRQQKRAERISEELERKKDMELHRLQMNFFTNISHQLRIPLSLILGPLEAMIEQKRFSGDTERRMQLLSLNARKMKSLLDELLQYTKIKGLQKRVHLVEGDVQAFIHSITDGFLPYAEEHGIDFQVSVPVEGKQVWYSPRDLEKIVVNLLSNAFKYTGKGSIMIASAVDDSSGSPRLQLSVEDTGIGISPDKLPNIFEAYYQAHEMDIDGQSGFGIGLALTKELVELHKGTIDVTSTPGKGSRFDVTLCVDKSMFPDACLSSEGGDRIEPRKYELLSIGPDPEPVATASSANKSAKKHTILVVEDDPELLQFYNELFSRGYRVLLAQNGEEGLDMAQNYLPDVIISDVMMPGMNGLEMVNKLKCSIVTSHIPVILLTAKSGAESEYEGYHSGADFYLEKPFHPRILSEQVGNILNTRDKLIRRYIAGQVDAQEIFKNNLDSKFISKIDAIIKSNLANESFSINDLTSSAGISRTQLHLKLKSLVGMSSTEYINHIRLKEAIVKLQAGYRVSEAAYATGFSSPNYFSRLFRKVYGTSPSSFVKEK